MDKLDYFFIILPFSKNDFIFISRYGHFVIINIDHKKGIYNQTLIFNTLLKVRDASIINESLILVASDLGLAVVNLD